MGLESQLITGITDKGENHAWNQVKVDGDWYNSDVTWADTDDGDEVIISVSEERNPTETTAESGTAVTTSEQSIATDSSAGSPVIIVIIVIAAVAAIGAVVFVIIKRKSR